MSPRAVPMPPEARRKALVSATLPLLREHGRAVTTRQIAQAAGVAEGTIFRVFDSKEELVEAAIAQAFHPGAVLDRLAEIDPRQSLELRLLLLVSILQQRFRATFDLMAKVGMVGPPRHDSAEADRVRATMHEAIVGVVAGDADDLDLPPDQFIHRLRLLTFAGTHPHISDGHLLSPEQIVATLLHGHLRNHRCS